MAFGRVCTAAELQQGLGCPAGQFPDANGCRSAGDHPAVPAPKDVPELPAAAAPHWCLGEGGTAEPCEQGCAVDAVPNAAGCAVQQGVAADCPPGFAVDASVAVPDFALPACKADPADCGDDPFGGATDGPGTLFVDAAVAAAGSGARAAPLKDLGQAVAAAKAGATIVVAAGNYTLDAPVTMPLTVRGRCAALVTLQVADKVGFRANDPTAKTQLERLRLTGAGGGVAVLDGGTLSAKRVWFDQVTAMGAYAVGSTLQLQDVVIAQVQPDATGMLGRGINAGNGATVTLTHVRIAQCRDHGLYLGGPGSKLKATELAVDFTKPRQAKGDFGRGIGVEAGAAATFDHLRLAGNAHSGLYVHGAATAVTVSNARVSGTQGNPAMASGGTGIFVKAGAQATIDRAVLAGNRESGLTAEGQGTVVQATVLAVSDTQPQLVSGSHGVAVEARDFAKLSVSLGWFDHNRDAGALAHDNGQMALANTVIADTQPTSAKQNGAAAVVGAGGSLTLTEVRLSKAFASGLLVAQGSANCTSLTVDHIAPELQTGRGGTGITVLGGSALSATNVRASANHLAGILVSGTGATATLVGLVLDRTIFEVQDSGTAFGAGMIVHGGAQVHATGLRATLNDVAGLVAAGGGQLYLRGARIDASRPTAGSHDGYGVLAAEGARLFVTGAVLPGNTAQAFAAGGTDCRAYLSDARIEGTLAAPEDHEFGRGVACQVGGELQLHGVRIAGSRDVGVSIWQATLAAVGCVVQDTGVNENDQAGGVGVAAINDSALVWTASQVARSHSAAMMVDHSTAHLQNSTLVGTLVAGAHDKDGNVGQQLADGLVIQDAAVDLAACIVAGSPRAQLVGQASAGLQLQGSALLGGAFGVVLQKQSVAKLTATLVAGQSVQSQASDQGLTLPDPPKLAAVPKKD